MSLTRAGVQPRLQQAVSYSNPNAQAPSLTPGASTNPSNPAALAAAFGAPNYAVLPVAAKPTPATWVVSAAF